MNLEIDTAVAEAQASELLARSVSYRSIADSCRIEVTRLDLLAEPAATIATRQLATASGHLGDAGGLIAELTAAAAAADAPWVCAGASEPLGDLDGTFSCVDRPAWVLRARPESGRELIATALADTADDTVVAADEFEIIRVDDHKYVLVLAGVTDLTCPNIGYDERSHTVRDLDRGAIASSPGASVAGNEYAQYVSDAVAAYIPNGSEIAIIGHSYGADTALDLAADETFNGGRYHVTHVAAFGYHVKNHIGSVPQRTEVLSVTNSRDLVVAAESVADGPVVVADGARELAISLAGRDVAGVKRAAGRVTAGGLEIIRDLASAPTAPGVITRSDPTVVSDGNHHQVRFDGGLGRDGGHGQTRYIQFVEGTELDVVTAFGRSLTEHGYAPTESELASVAVDVSKRP